MKTETAAQPTATVTPITATPNKLNSERLQGVFEKSIEVIELVLDNRKVDGNMLKAAVSMIASYSKIRATEIQAATLIYQVAKDIAVDKAELKKLLIWNVPGVKLIEEKK